MVRSSSVCQPSAIPRPSTFPHLIFPLFLPSPSPCPILVFCSGCLCHQVPSSLVPQPLSRRVTTGTTVFEPRRCICNPLREKECTRTPSITECPSSGKSPPMLTRLVGTTTHLETEENKNGDTRSKCSTSPDWSKRTASQTGTPSKHSADPLFCPFLPFFSLSPLPTFYPFSPCRSYLSFSFADFSYKTLSADPRLLTPRPDAVRSWCLSCRFVFLSLAL